MKKVTWFFQTTGGTNFLYDVTCTDALTCWAVGSGDTIMKTTNGGETWTFQSSGYPNPNVSFMSVAFVDSRTGWVVTSGGAILRTVDGGATWTPQTSPTTAGLNSVAFLDAANGWAVGYRGTIIRYSVTYSDRVFLPLASKNQVPGW